jgi:hypothetical protein
MTLEKKMIMDETLFNDGLTGYAYSVTLSI